VGDANTPHVVRAGSQQQRAWATPLWMNYELIIHVPHIKLVREFRILASYKPMNRAIVMILQGTYYFL